MNSDFDDEEGELAWITELARETGRPVWFLITLPTRSTTLAAIAGRITKLRRTVFL